MEAASSTLSSGRPYRVELQEKINIIGHSLADSIRRIVENVPGGPHRPQELSRALGINKDLSSRALNACKKQDPLAAIHAMPGPEGLRQLLTAARRKGVAIDVIASAEDAVRDFDGLIRNDAGDRAGLDAIIGAWLPDSREKIEMTARQSVFRGMASLKGHFVRTAVVTFMVCPSRNAALQVCDTVVVAGLLGLRRMRPGAVVECSSTLKRVPGTPGAESEAIGPLLQEFCAPEALQLHMRTEGERIYYNLADNGVGPRSAADVWLAEPQDNFPPRWQDEHNPGHRRFFCATVEQPTRTLIFDVLLHEDVWAGREPELFVYDTTVSGLVDVNDRARDGARFDVPETIQRLGKGLSGVRATEVPNYARILQSICTRKGWDGERLRAYRCRLQFPVYGCQVGMVFDPPAAPAWPTRFEGA
jgi:hypothetical protein